MSDDATARLPRSTPTDAGVDARGIGRFLDAVDALDGVELHSLMVCRSGRVVAEGWWAPYAPERPHLVYSVSKSFTSTALGLAVAEGLVDLDATVLSYFPELDADVTDDRARSIRVRHVAAMASGHAEETVGPASLDEEGDLLRGFLRIPPDVEPGTLFTYNQPCTFALAAIVQRVSGTGLLEFLRPRLLEPLGIGELGWIRDGRGRELGFSGLHAPTEALAKLGLLYLQEGVWEGRRLLPAEWVAEARRSHVDTSAEEKIDWAQGYGFQFWVGRHGYRADGAYGQFSLVLPEQDAVVAITSQTVDTPALLAAVWEHLLPALTAGSGDEEADDAVRQRLSDGRLAGPAGDPAPAPEGTYRPGTDVEPASLARVGVGGGRVVLEEDGVETSAPLGEGWPGGEPLTTAGARRADGTYALDVAFVETPHRLHLVLDPADGTFTSRWGSTPLHVGSLAELRVPTPLA
ncbi:serine hydrolase domain-containing protein [Kineococcus gynurae]|uniref:Serine hydrolase domain-containing protein n=1 Tax=Kineococcus gynurae TaxID=452979 RepID=A0ABV5LQ06_9ACTN